MAAYCGFAEVPWSVHAHTFGKSISTISPDLFTGVVHWERRPTFALNFPFLHGGISAILLAWVNAVRRGNAPYSFCFSMI